MSRETIGGMSKTTVALMLLMACHPYRDRPYIPIAQERQEVTANQLNEVQLECRSTDMIDIGQANAEFGPQCDRPTMPLALEMYDFGALGGEMKADDWSFASTMLCICRDGPCSEKEQATALANVQTTMIDNRGKRLREGVAGIVDRLVSHSCLDVTLGASLYKMGFQCGFAKKLHGREARRKMLKLFQSVFVDDEKARAGAQRCFVSE